MTPSAMAQRRWKGVSKAERSALMQRAGQLGGRPVKLVKCPRGCGAELGTVAMRAHRCPLKRGSE